MVGVFIQVNDDSLKSRSHPIGYVVCENGCWEWVGNTDSQGYGRLTNRATRKMAGAHRFMYERLVGPVPAGLTLDHLCRNRACCNPSHLEPVTHRENALRGVSFAAVNARKTHCAKCGGDLLVTGEKRPGCVVVRRCPQCRRAQERRRYTGTPEQRLVKRDQMRRWRARYRASRATDGPGEPLTARLGLGLRF